MQETTEKMIFKSRKDILFHILITASVGLVLFRIFLNGKEKYAFMWTDILLLLVVAFLLWIYFGTEYELTEKELKYRSGPIRGQIEIKNIKEIIKGKSLWSGLKPAMARNGLIVKYGKYDEIYISPKTNDKFVDKILEINENIKITSD